MDINVDYRKSAAEVYVEFIESYSRARQTCLCCGHAAEKLCIFLSWAGLARNHCGDMPSWVSDFSARYHPGQFLYPRSPQGSLGRLSAIEHQPKIEYRSLHIAGARIQPVKRVAKIDPPGQQEIRPASLTINLDLLDLVRDLIIKDTQRPDDTPALQKIFRIFATDSSPVDMEMVTSAFMFFMEWIFRGSFGLDFDTLARSLNLSFQQPCENCEKDEIRRWFVCNFFPNHEAYCNTSMLEYDREDPYTQFLLTKKITACPGNVVFETEGGYLGLGPREMAVGDFICVLNGFNSPVFLRKFNSNFVYIGACFALELMEDEPKGLLEEGQVYLERFRIR
jgi:hypothetical protein